MMKLIQAILLVSVFGAILCSAAFAETAEPSVSAPCTYLLKSEVSPGLESVAEKMTANTNEKLSKLGCKVANGNDAPKYVLKLNAYKSESVAKLEAIFQKPEAGRPLEHQEILKVKLLDSQVAIRKITDKAMPMSEELVANVQGNEAFSRH